ncbi:MAG: hypothetical protein AAFN94_07315 [Pseudomonadota bacterium]
MIRALVLSLLCAGPALAQDPLTAEEFLDRLQGRTATFIDFNSGQLVGIEEFVRRDRTVWARANGTCAYGLVYIEDGAVCFDYDDDPPGVTHCWMPFERDDTMYVLSTGSGQIQQISEIDDDGVSCEPPALS